VLLAYIIGFSVLGSLGSLVAAGAILAFPRGFKRFQRPFLAFALGTLLGVTFLDVLPEAVRVADPSRVLATVLVGFLAFLVLERVLHRHVPGEPAPDHDHALSRGAGHAVLVGDTLHNLVDGVMITAAFLVSVPLGIATAIAVFAHEIPQELGDLAILLNSGFNPWQAYAFNFLSGLASLVGAIAAYMAQAAMPSFIPYMLALAAASFLYLVAANLDPVVHHTPSRRNDVIQMGSLLAGVAGLFVLHHFLA
jgi:zinc and cadmium transporter